MNYRIRPAAYAVIVDDQRRLACVAEDSGLFLPGGGLEPGEDALQAVHRECAEECGRTIEIIQPLDSAIQWFIKGGNEAYELHASFFLARFSGLLDRPGHLELSWHAAWPDPPALFHECQRWAVREGMKRARNF